MMILDCVQHKERMKEGKESKQTNVEPIVTVPSID